MTVLRLAGCRSESLLGYLKALGILRLFAAQADAAARGSWDGAVFVIDTLQTEDAMERFFLDAYIPTPILNPWNSGAGFDGKDDMAARTMRRVAQTTGRRWQAYRDSLAFIAKRYVDSGLRTQRYKLDSKDAKERDKLGFLRDLRAKCPEALLAWLDAAVLLTPGRADFPYLFGSGGNDGRLDFSVNFAARALDVCGDKPIASARELLHDSLQDTSQARLLQDVAIGQFSPRHTGGANATSGFDAMSLVNPWDYVLMMEGALLFTGSIGRRTDTAPGRPAFPFALRSVAGGYGSASVEQVRGELWLPVWSGRASLASVVDLLRKGRIDIPGSGKLSILRDAVVASDAAAAVVTMGVALGIRRLERTAFAQRNGLAFSATTIGSLTVSDRYDRGIAVLSRDVAAWIDRLRRRELGGAARDALAAFFDKLFEFPNVPPLGAERARARQGLLVSLADLDRAIARIREADVPSMPQLDPEIVSALDDGTVEHRAALAIASLGARARVRYKADEVHEENEELRTAGDDPAKVLVGFLERRMRLDANDPGAGWLRASCMLSADDSATFLTFTQGSAQRARFGRLLRAYWHVRLASAESPIVPHDETIPAAYAVLKLVFDNPKARDERAVRLLCSHDCSRGLRLAVQRARAIRELPAPRDDSRQAPRDVSGVVLEDSVWYAAALALPIEQSPAEYRKLLNAALVDRISWDQRDRIDSYLTNILRQRKEYPS